MARFTLKDSNTSLWLLRIFSLLIALGYMAFGFLLKHVFNIDDMIPLVHRLLFATAFSGLVLLSHLLSIVRQYMALFLYILSSISVFHVMLIGTKDGFDAGSIVALLLVIPVMNFLFYHSRPLLRINALLLAGIIGIFISWSPSLLQALLFTISCITISGVSFWFTKRLLFSEERAKESEELFYDLFHHSTGGIGIHELILDPKGEPVDYVFLKVNKTFERFTGLKAEDILGRRVTEVLPGIEQSPFIARYGEVVLQERTLHFEQFAEQLERYYRIAAYPMGKNRFATIFDDITELKRAEKELEESRQRYQHIVDTQQEMICRFRHDTTLTFANPAYQRFFHLTDKDINRTKFLHLAPQEEHRAIRERLKRLASGEPSLPYEHRTTINGETYWHQWREYPIFDDKGMIQEYQSVGYDITALKKTQEELERSESKYRSLVEQSSEMMYVHDLKGEILEVNKAAIINTQYSKEELLSKSIFDLHQDPLDKEWILQQWQDWRVEDAPVTLEQEHKRKDGSIFSGEMTSRKIYYRGYQCILALVRDITERKESEKKLRERDQLLTKLVQQVPGAVYQYQLDPEGKSYFPFTSDGIWDIYEVTPDEVKANASLVYSRIHEEDLEKVIASIQHSFDTLSIWTDVYRVVLPEKGLCWIRGVARPEKLPDGSVLWHGYLADISPMKEVTQELESQKNLLEGIIDGLKDVLAIQYPDHTIERYNKAGYQMLGLTPEDVQGKKCYELLGRTRECDVCASRRSLKTKRLESVEKYIPEMNVYLECNSNPILDSHGRVVRIIEQLRDVTEKKMYEKRILEERDYMFRIFNSINQYIIVNSIDYEIQFMNQKAIEDLGDLVGAICYQQLEKDSPCKHCPIDQLMNREKTIVNYTIETSQHILEATATILTNLDGSLSILEVLEDITAERETENALRESEEKFRQIAETMGEVFWLRSADNREMIYINPAYETIWGRTCESLYKNPLSFMESVFSADRPALSAEYDSYAKTGEFNLEYRIVRPSNELRWIHARSFPVRDKDHKIIRHTGLAVDITKRKEMEREVIKSEQKFRNYIDSAPYGIFVTDEKGDYLEVNEAACKLTGYGEDELIGMNLLQLIPQRYRDTAAEHFRLVSKKKTAYAEVPYLRKDREEKLWGISAIRISSDRFLGFVQDITERKQDEEKLLEYTTELELRGMELDTLYKILNQEIDNARHVHKQLLQSSIPIVQGLSIAAACTPATYIGGDFYQVIHKENRLLLYLSDATGHGLDGTMFSLFVKNSIESYVELTPVEDLCTESTLDYLDAQVRKGDYPEEYAVAIFLMIIDLQTKEATYSGAGFQNAPILMKEDGEMKTLVSRGLPISQNVPRELMDFNEKKVVLPEDSYLFLSTDGLYEQLHRTVMYEERLKGVLEKSAGLPESVILDLVQSDFHEFLGDEDPADDISIVVISTGDSTRITVPSSFHALEELREQVIQYYHSYEDGENIALAIHELVANAIEHGNQCNDEKSIVIQLSSKAIVVEDEGIGFDWPSYVKRGLSIHCDSQRGRGIALVQALMGDLIYNQKGNRASLILKRSAYYPVTNNR